MGTRWRPETMDLSTVELPPCPPPHPGMVCQRCKSTELRTNWQRFSDGKLHCRCECPKCGGFVRYLPATYRHEPRPPGAHEHNTKPPADDSPWLGFVRLSDGIWRAVALA